MCCMDGLSKKLRGKLDRLQNQAMRISLQSNRRSCCQELRDNLGVLTLKIRRHYLRFLLVFRIINDMNCPSQLKGKLTRRAEMHTTTVRDTSTLNIPRVKSTAGEKNIWVLGSKRLEQSTLLTPRPVQIRFFLNQSYIKPYLKRIEKIIGVAWLSNQEMYLYIFYMMGFKFILIILNAWWTYFRIFKW